MIRILLLILFGVGISAKALAGPAKDSYSPYPQIIQNHDYPTIKAIETFVARLKTSSRDSAACSAARNLIEQVNYSVPNTTALFATLRRLLGDLSHKQPCRAVKFDQFPTRAYTRRTIVEFDFGSTVVIVDAFSNGSTDPERLYILDTVERSQSFFWGHVP
ncbi:MAG: hypothetical protein LBQ20_05610 [Rhodanobacter sp.]|jgi:hypothetical protein|nr:hypothetical protein [Rhodanobacter sp.]